ncbi:unnamed protein product [Durusdinium trenchii]|uniref:Alcohol dehydrogenase-like N-terminal domain-containing protein n=1 Tax=Durusdinium trenchii TaxID=1381693 RepID=A0ABP0NDZ0_9DINO
MGAPLKQSDAARTEDRGLQVIPGSPPRASTVRIPRQNPSAEEVLVRVQAAALTATDVELCRGTLLARGQSIAFVPGIFFSGKVLSVGKLVHGLRIGELVLGVRPEAIGREDPAEPDASGGCYRECLCVHFSALLPLEGLVEAKFEPTTILAHVPPMASALMCVGSQLRLQPSQALLLLAPHLEQAIFILQRLLISESWLGPLYLVLLSGSLSREELQHHPLLQPLIEGFAENFLKDMHCFSVEDWTQGPNRHTSTLLQEIVSEVHRKTGGVGVDVILALDLDLGPEDGGEAADQGLAKSFCRWSNRSKSSSFVVQEKVLDATSDMDAACVALEPVPRQPSLLRTLGRVLAFGGRLVTSSSSMEMSPEDAQHFWAKECSISFFNPHCVPLAMLRHGELLHAAADVCGRIAAGELCIVDSAVAQFYLFDQFQQALDAASHQQGVRKYSGEASGAQLVALLL